MNACHYIPARPLNDKDYQERFKFLFKNVCYLLGQGCGGGGIQSIVAGTDISVDDTDPLNPIVNSEAITYFNSDFTGAGTIGDPISLANPGGGGGLIEITYADLVTAIGADGLTAGAMYKITDRGDRGLFFNAITTYKLAKDGTRLMLCPADYAVEVDGSGNDWIGVWTPDKTVTTNQLTIWGGQVWKNLTGNIGSLASGGSVFNINPNLDDTNWQLIDKNSFSNNEYVEMSFGVNYDVTNDWIERQWDAKGNVFGYEYYVSILAPGFNPCDISDWNYSSGDENRPFFNNKYPFISGNDCPGGIYNNQAPVAINYRGIGMYQNYGLDIFDNISFESGISNNVGTYTGGSINRNYSAYISYNITNNIGENYCVSGISDNTVNYIYNNVCNSISGCSVTGDIYLNRNNGDIYDCSGPVSIFRNTNNGDISGTYASDVTDTQVDK